MAKVVQICISEARFSKVENGFVYLRKFAGPKASLEIVDNRPEVIQAAEKVEETARKVAEATKKRQKNLLYELKAENSAALSEFQQAFKNPARMTVQDRQTPKGVPYQRLLLNGLKNGDTVQGALALVSTSVKDWFVNPTRERLMTTIHGDENNLNLLFAPIGQEASIWVLGENPRRLRLNGDGKFAVIRYQPVETSTAEVDTPLDSDDSAEAMAENIASMIGAASNGSQLEEEKPKKSSAAKKKITKKK